jgi:hypothetical protein
VVPLIIGDDPRLRDTLPYGLRLKHGLKVSNIADLEAAASELRDLIDNIDKVPASMLIARSLALETQTDDCLSLRTVSEGTKVGARAVRAFASILAKAVASGFVAVDMIKDRRERVRLGELLKHLMSIEYSQAPLPWLLREYVHEVRQHPQGSGKDQSVRDRRFRDRRQYWHQATSRLAYLTPVVAQVVELLAACQGDFIPEQREMAFPKVPES